MKKNFLNRLMVNLLLFWTISGVLIIPKETAIVILRQGKYHKTLSHGIHWYMRFIDKPFKLDLSNKRQYITVPFALTKEGVLVSAQLVFDYQIENAHQFLLKNQEPLQYLYDVILGSLHTSINQHTMKELLQKKTVKIIQNNIKQTIYLKIPHDALGVIVKEITLSDFKLPLELQKEFKSVQDTYQKASQIEYKTKIEQEEMQHKLDLHAKQQYEEANTVRHQTILTAQADVNKFLQLVPLYEKEPKLVIQQLYFATVESMLKHNSKIFLFENSPTHAKAQPMLQISSEKNTLVDYSKLLVSEKK